MSPAKARLFVVIVTALAACGGSAVIDADTDGAGGSGAMGTSSNMSTSTTPPMVTTTTGMVTPSLCDDACDSLAQCSGDPGSCLAGCEQRSQGNCGEIHQRWMSCSLGETNTMCGFGPGQICGADLISYLECTGELVGEITCTPGPGVCGCDAFVSPGVVIEQRCDPVGCRCFIGGDVVGTCDVTEPCDLIGGCCAGVLFTGGP